MDPTFEAVIRKDVDIFRWVLSSAYKWQWQVDEILVESKLR